ncbi:MAG: hypothetical protein HY541_05155 [Deltaproteobacteria bacterium]|nr:hypothetical protein [Deltaproteobacteria bacterium]
MSLIALIAACSGTNENETPKAETTPAPAKKEESIPPIDLAFTEGLAGLSDGEKSLIDIAKSDGDFYLEESDFEINPQSLQSKELIGLQSASAGRLIWARDYFISGFARRELTALTPMEQTIVKEYIKQYAKQTPLSAFPEMLQGLNILRTLPVFTAGGNAGDKASFGLTAMVDIILANAVHLNDDIISQGKKPVSPTFSADMMALHEQILQGRLVGGVESLDLASEALFHEDTTGKMLGTITIDRLHMDDMARVGLVIIHEAVHAHQTLTGRDKTMSLTDMELEAHEVDGVLMIYSLGEKQAFHYAAETTARETEKEKRVKNGLPSLTLSHETMLHNKDILQRMDTIADYQRGKIYGSSKLEERKFALAQSIVSSNDVGLQEQQRAALKTAIIQTYRFNYFLDIGSKVFNRIFEIKAIAKRAPSYAEVELSIQLSLNIYIQQLEKEMPNVRGGYNYFKLRAERMFLEAFNLAAQDKLIEGITYVDTVMVPFLNREVHPGDEEVPGAAKKK